MQNRSEQNYKKWFQKAEDDELSIKAILKEKGAPSTACFLSQQMAEKYLKGLLVFYKKPFPKIHDLLTLETLLLNLDPDIKEYEKELDLLNRYYVETRYPGDFPEGFSWTMAREAFEAAVSIKEFVSERITQ